MPLTQLKQLMAVVGCWDVGPGVFCIICLFSFGASVKAGDGVDHIGPSRFLSQNATLKPQETELPITYSRQHGMVREQIHSFNIIFFLCESGMASLYVAIPVCHPWYVLYHNHSSDVHLLAWTLYSQGIGDTQLCGHFYQILSGTYIAGTQNHFPIKDKVYLLASHVNCLPHQIASSVKQRLHLKNTVLQECWELVLSTHVLKE